MKILKVIPATKIPLANAQVYTYYSQKNLPAGSIVKVPLRGRDTEALVFESESLEEKKQEVKKNTFKLKKIESIVSEEPIFDKTFFELLFWSSSYWWEPAGLLAKTALPAKFYDTPALEKISPLENQEASKKSLLILDDKESDILKSKINSVLEEGKKVLSIYPEVQQVKDSSGLVPDRFSSEKFWGSRTRKNRFQVWLKSREKDPFLLRGTKKALFFPWNGLGLIVVNEEENTHYKSWGRHPKYHGKHLAFKLAQLHNCPLILTAHGPSVSTFYNYKNKNYKLLNTESSVDKCMVREGQVKIIDRTREEWQKGEFSYLSPKLLKEVNKIAKNKGKILFLHPRRGTSTSVFCQDCGYFFRCPDCSVSMNFHKSSNSLQCHYCGRKKEAPVVCEKCRSHRLKYGGTGTEKLETTLAQELPDLKGLRLDSDSASTQKKKKELVEKFEKEDYDYVLATQMVLSSALSDFDLIGILNIDLFLDQPSFQSHARTLSMLKKLEKKSPKLILQTYEQEQEILNIYKSEEYEQFYNSELKLREKFFYPPFCQLSKIEYSHKSEKESLREAKIMKAKMERRLEQMIDGGRVEEDELRILGPSPSSPAKKQGKFFHKLTIKADRTKLGQRNKLLEIVPTDWEIDVEPEEV